MNSDDRLTRSRGPALAWLTLSVLVIGSSGAADTPPDGVAAPAVSAEPAGARPQSGAGPASAETRQQQPLGPEDLLEISVFEVPELNRTVRISATGTISVPLLGEMQIAGLTAMELEGRLREELRKKYVRDPQVSVFVREYGSKRVSVIGAVGKPGVYEMLGPRTLLQVLSQAGGLTERCGAELYVIRNGDHREPGRIAVNVADLLANRDPALNVSIHPGDVISAPIDPLIYIYVDGAVKSPGRIEQLASRPITLLQAIAKAGGATERANLKKIQVLRQSEDGTQAVIEVNLKRMRKGRTPDPILRDGDLVVVLETFF